MACGGTCAFRRAAQWIKADSRRQATHFRQLGYTHEAGQVNDADHRPAYVTSDFILELTWRAETASHRSLPTGRPPRADPGTKNPILNTFLSSANGAGGNARGLWMRHTRRSQTTAGKHAIRARDGLWTPAFGTMLVSMTVSFGTLSLLLPWMAWFGVE